MIIMITIKLMDIISIEIINPKNLKLLEMNIDNKFNFVHHLLVNIKQKLCLFKFQLLLLLNFLLEHFKIVFNSGFYHI